MQQLSSSTTPSLNAASKNVFFVDMLRVHRQCICTLAIYSELPLGSGLLIECVASRLHFTVWLLFDSGGKSIQADATGGNNSRTATA